MTEEKQKDRLSSQINIENLRLAVPLQNVLVKILKSSDQCFHSIG